MRLFVAGGGFADREGLFAHVAAVTARAGFGQPDGLVAFAYRNGVVGAGFIRAGRFWCDHQVLEEASSFLGDGGVAFDGGVFAARTAMEGGNASGRLDDVAVLQALCGSALQYGNSWGNAVVAASGILAEIDLDTVSFGGHSTRTCCGRINARNDHPLWLYTKWDYTLLRLKHHTPLRNG